MQIKVEKGRGYVPGNMRYAADEETKGDRPHHPRRLVQPGAPRDATRSKSARVEQRTDLDKLIIDIETNGAIEPEEAIRYAARVLVDQLVGVRRS